MSSEHCKQNIFQLIKKNGSMAKIPPAKQETWVWSLGWEDPLPYGNGKSYFPRKWQPTPVFLPRKFQGQRKLAAAIHRVAKSQTWLSTHTPHPTLQLLLLAPRLSHRKPQFYSSHAILSSFLQGKAWRQLCQSLLQHFQGLSTDPSTHNHSFHSTSGPSQLAPGPAPPHLQRSLLQVPYSLAKMTKS